MAKDAAYYREYRARRATKAQPVVNDLEDAFATPQPVAEDLQPTGTMQDGKVVFAAAPDSEPVEFHAKERPIDPFAPATPESEQPDRIDISRPPKRLPVRTKTIWQTLPEPLREDIIIREQEFNENFKAYDGLGIYRQAAEKAGTNLASLVKMQSEQLGQYQALEQQFKQAPLNTAMAVWQAVGHEPEVIRQELDRLVQGMMPSPGAAPDPVESKIAWLREDERNEFLPIVESQVQSMLRSDPTMPAFRAYEFACHSNTHVQELLRMRNRPRPQESRSPYQQAQRQAKATVGAPSSPRPAPREPAPPDSILDTVRQAYAKHK